MGQSNLTAALQKSECAYKTHLGTKVYDVGSLSFLFFLGNFRISDHIEHLGMGNALAADRILVSLGTFIRPLFVFQNYFLMTDLSIGFMLLLRSKKNMSQIILKKIMGTNFILKKFPFKGSDSS